MTRRERQAMDTLKSQVRFTSLLAMIHLAANPDSEMEASVTFAENLQRYIAMGYDGLHDEMEKELDDASDVLNGEDDE